MSVEFGCPACGKAIEGEPGTEVACRRCSAAASLSAVAPDTDLASCLACACPDLYKHRDFNQKLGILVVVIGFVGWLTTGSFLWMVAAVVIDYGLYHFLPDVVICYRCKAHHRDLRGIPKIAPFDLEKHEHYRFVKAREEGQIPPKREPKAD
ncbi:MAG: hypothetical protein V3T86_12365 [Planctomycetota bacterium]